MTLIRTPTRFQFLNEKPYFCPHIADFRRYWASPVFCKNRWRLKNKSQNIIRLVIKNFNLLIVHHTMARQ